jgi:hypothetical protein
MKPVVGRVIGSTGDKARLSLEDIREDNAEGRG